HKAKLCACIPAPTERRIPAQIAYSVYPLAGNRGKTHLNLMPIYDRRKTLLASQYIQMFTSGTLAVLMYMHVVQVWHIMGLSFITGVAQSFGGPAYQSLLPSLVDEKVLPNAIALNSIHINLDQVIGLLLLDTMF